MQLVNPLLHSQLAASSTDFCRESSAMLKFDDYSYFQTRLDSSVYYKVLLVPLVGKSFKAYEINTSPFAFSIGRSTNKSLQRELYHVEVQCLIMVFFRPTSCAAELELSS